MKRKRLIAILFVIILGISTGCGKKQPIIENNASTEEKIKQKDSEIIDKKDPGIVNEKVYNDVTIKDISFQYDGIHTTMVFEVLNTTDNGIILNRFDVELFDDTGTLVGSFNGYYAKEIPAHQSKNMTLEITSDFSKATTANFVFNNLVKE